MFTIDPIALLRLQYTIDQKDKDEELHNVNPSIVAIHCW